VATGHTGEKMSDLIILESIQDAIRILETAKRETAFGARPIWDIPHHAIKHLEMEVSQLISEK
jgi:hypothetical protein